MPHSLTWPAIVAERAPQIALLPRNRTSVVCSDYSQGAWELGPQREDEDLSVVWGLKGPLERRERIMTSQGLGIRTSLQPGCCCLIMFLVFTSSHCQPPDPCHPVRILLATRALHPLPLSPIKCCCCLLRFHGLGALTEQKCRACGGRKGCIHSKPAYGRRPLPYT